MNSIEFYFNQSKTMMMCEFLASSLVKRFDDLGHDFYQRYDAKISEIRPHAYKELCNQFGYGPQYAYDRTYQFTCCNFSTKDGQTDIDNDFNFITEIVSCPVRHICNRRYCKTETELSPREAQVIRLFAAGFDEKQIADQLFISPATVHNHITNIYKTLCFTGAGHPDRLLINYAHRNNLLTRK